MNFNFKIGVIFIEDLCTCQFESRVDAGTCLIELSPARYPAHPLNMQGDIFTTKMIAPSPHPHQIGGNYIIFFPLSTRFCINFFPFCNFSLFSPLCFSSFYSLPLITFFSKNRTCVSTPSRVLLPTSALPSTHTRNSNEK